MSDRTRRIAATGGTGATIRACGWIVRKDLAVFFADRQGAVMAVLLPVLLAALLGFLFGPPDLSGTVRVLVADADGSEGSARLVRRLKDDAALRVEETDAAEARRQVSAGDAPAAILLPSGLGAALGDLTGEPPEIRLLVDPSRVAEAGIVTGATQRAALRAMIDDLRRPEVLKQTIAKVRAWALLGPLEQDRAAWLTLASAADALVSSAGTRGDDRLELGLDDGELPGVRVAREDVSATNELADYNSYAHTFAGMLCMFLLFFAIDGARELAVEREQGLLLRLRLAPHPERLILVGRFVSLTLLGLLISAAVYGAGFAIFDIEVRGSVAGFAVLILAQALFAAGFGLLLAGLGRTERQITNLGNFLVPLLSFLGGAWLPSFLMPEWLQGATAALPTSQATHGLAAMTWRGLPFEACALPAAVLVAYAAVCAVIGARAFRWHG